MTNSIAEKILQLPIIRRIAIEIREIGKPKPQPAEHPVKQAAIQKYAQEFGTSVLVETGTHEGEMIQAMKSHFAEIHSIELDKAYFDRAVKRFSGDAHVTIHHGDSGQKLADLMPDITKPTLFWLDGHYSGGDTGRGDLDTPIIAELNHILGAADLGHVIMIDDARLFGRNLAYPTIASLERSVQKLRPNLKCKVENDAIIFAP